MSIIIIENLAGKAIENEDKSEKLLQVLLRHSDWMHACGGNGRCTTCKAIVIQGMEHFDPITEAERKYILLNKLQPNERLCCQVSVSGDVVISVSEENKLPHLKYSS